MRDQMELFAVLAFLYCRATWWDCEKGFSIETEAALKGGER